MVDRDKLLARLSRRAALRAGTAAGTAALLGAVDVTAGQAQVPPDPRPPGPYVPPKSRFYADDQIGAPITLPPGKDPVWQKPLADVVAMAGVGARADDPARDMELLGRLRSIARNQEVLVREALLTIVRENPDAQVWFLIRRYEPGEIPSVEPEQIISLNIGGLFGEFATVYLSD